MDSKENAKKCTVAPLADRSDFRFILYDRGLPIPALNADFLLHMDGTSIADVVRPAGARATLAVIDCHWKACGKILRSIAAPLPALVRIPDDFQTAYPRKSKLYDDPAGGLATIEAMFIAAAAFGVWDETLLAKYHWKDAFLAANAAALAPLRPH
jgi:pre-rRNA-processing protein TSR3